MDFSKVCVFLDNGHGEDTPGKCSPDKSIREYAYTREIVKRIDDVLQSLGINTFIVTPETNNISLTERVGRVNTKHSQCKRKGIKTLLISVHLNAAGNGTKWMNASGWSVYIAKNASKNSKLFAQLLFDEADSLNLLGNRFIPVDKYFMENFTIVSKTMCPAVLTENMFQDNKEDVKWLLSDVGKTTLVNLHVNAILNYINTLK